MVAKILSKTGTFNAVRYNSNKQAKGSAELIDIKNFKVLKPETMTAADVKNYLKSYSDVNKRVKNPQFHATISCKGREYSPEQLKEIGNQYMDKMGYGEQPYIILFHNDTNNNHIHIVSTRVDANGKKINDSYENVRSLNAIQEIMKKSISRNNDLDLNALKGYKFETKNQFISLLKLHKFEVREKDNVISIYKMGAKCEDVALSDMKFFLADKKAISQLKQEFSSLSGMDKKIYPVFNSNNEIVNYKSEFTKQLKSKNIEIVFHFSESKKPFGYTVIDSSRKEVFRGSLISKLNNILSLDEQEYVSQTKGKSYSERLIASKYNVSTQREREMLSHYLSIDIANVQLNDKIVSKEDFEKYKIFFSGCKSVNDLDDIKRFNSVDLYSYKSDVYLITAKKQIINLNELIEDKKLLADYHSLHKEQLENKGKYQIYNEDDIDEEKDVSEIEDEHVKADSSIDIGIETAKGIMTAFGSQGSAEPEKKRKKRNRNA
ncbi:MAG: relaxase/mobilization nuclease domain-containing protein [Bacteroidia bacterium]|nr:relaxase/mobilization nuclease domain-containing protein [Bacteroidia bacterium]